MNTARKGLAVLSAALLTVAAQAVMIDDFTSGPYTITANSVNPIVEAVTPGTMLGGERDVLLQWTGGPLSVNASVNITGGGLQFFNGSSETSGMLFLQYDGFDGELINDGFQTAGTGLGANFSGDNAFVLDFAFLDGGLSTLQLTVTVISTSGTSSVLTNIGNGTNFSHIVWFNQFSNVNWSQVQNVTFAFNAGPASDFTLQSIYTANIPGPVAILPFLLGLVGLRRRKR